MSKYNAWELEDVYTNACNDLRLLEDEYKMAEIAEKEDLEDIKNKLLEQRTHVCNLQKLKNEFEKNQALREANETEKTKACISAIAVVPIAIGTTRAVYHMFRKIIGFIP